jgi:hypothetical protein
MSGDVHNQRSVAYLFSLSMITLNRPFFAFFLGSSAVACCTTGGLLSNVTEEPGFRVIIFCSRLK